jgi:hypothetical protein
LTHAQIFSALMLGKLVSKLFATFRNCRIYGVCSEY